VVTREGPPRERMAREVLCFITALVRKNETHTPLTTDSRRRILRGHRLNRRCVGEHGAEFSISSLERLRACSSSETGEGPPLTRIQNWIVI
jgi:hypothetical protein